MAVENGLTFEAGEYGDIQSEPKVVGLRVVCADFRK